MTTYTTQFYISSARVWRNLIPVLLLCLLAGVHAQAQWQPEIGPSAYSSLTWSEIRTHETAQHTIGRTTDGRVYVWGHNFYSEIHTHKIKNNDYQSQTTPFYVPLPSGEVAKKVGVNTSDNGSASFVCLTQSGKLYGWGMNGGMFGTTAWPIAPSSLPALDTLNTRRKPVLISIPNETVVLDFAVSYNSLLVIGGSGKAYYNGRTNGTYVSNFRQLPFPPNVTSYQRAWMPLYNNNQVFFKGDDNKIYAIGSFSQYFTSGAAALNNIASYNFNLFTDVPQEVPFPNGDEIDEVYPSTYTSLALSKSGKAYGTGIWYSTKASIIGIRDNPYVGVYFFPLKTTPAASDLTKTIAFTDTTFFTNKFLEVPLPAGATKFINLENQTYASLRTLYFVTDDNKVYWRGTANNQTLQNFLEYPALYTDFRCERTTYVSSVTPYSFVEEAINLRGATKVFFDGSSTGIGYVLSKSNRGYAFGTSATGFYTGTGKSNGSTIYPTPIANEQLDYCNPSKGTGGGVITSAGSATGVINCAKTQLAPAPVVGVPGQTGLIVTIAVSATGTFAPISVTGSGMSVANGITALTASATGTQQFYIPLQYDGTALGTLNFTIGTATNAGSCAANLSSPPKQAITNIWTLDCVPTVGPPLK